MKLYFQSVFVSLLALTILTSAAIAQSGGTKNADAERTALRISTLSRSIADRAARGLNSQRAAKERFDLMRSLAETAPAKVLENALPDETLAALPEGSRKYFETREKVEGELEVLAECEEHDGRVHYFLRQSGGRLSLYFSGEPDNSFLTGKKVTLDGVRLGDTFVATADAMTSIETAAKTVESNALTGTTGEKRVLVILVNFQDNATQPFTVEQARDVTFNQSSNYYREVSYGQTWLTGDVYGWFTIPMSSTSCDLAAIANYAQQAATNAGASLSSYDHQVYAFPKNACSWAGSGSLGANPGQVWINNTYTVNTVAHELGHNFGLFHSQSLDCGAQTIGGTCTTNEYGDVFDIMGGGASAHINLFQKERLGWVNYGSTPTVETVTSSGTYWINAYEPNTPGSKGLKILRSTDPATGKKTWYYVERRTPYGFDSYLANIVNMVNGVVIHSGSEASGRDGYILDTTPETSSWYDPALVSGQSFSDPSIGLKITTISADSTGAWVQVELGSQACTRANPTVSVTPGRSSWTSAGSMFSYQVSVTNNNAGGCASDSFQLSASVPVGLSAALSAGSLNLANGASGVAEIYVSSSSFTGDGAYDFAVTAANSANSNYTGSGAATHVIVSGLNVAAAAGAAKYSRNQTATVTANVTAAGSPVSGVSVTFTMTKPGGSTVTQTFVTGSDGRAVFSYKFVRKSDPTGTYTVNVVGSVKGYTGQTSTSFLVNK